MDHTFATMVRRNIGDEPVTAAYLEEAYRRFKLPISVKVVDGAFSDKWGYPLIVRMRGELVGGSYDAVWVKGLYLDTVRMLERETPPVQ